MKTEIDYEISYDNVIFDSNTSYIVGQTHSGPLFSKYAINAYNKDEFDEAAYLCLSENNLWEQLDHVFVARSKNDCNFKIKSPNSKNPKVSCTLSFDNNQKYIVLEDTWGNGILFYDDAKIIDNQEYLNKELTYRASEGYEFDENMTLDEFFYITEIIPVTIKTKKFEIITTKRYV